MHYKPYVLLSYVVNVSQGMALNYMTFSSLTVTGFPGSNFVAKTTRAKTYRRQANQIEEWSIQQINGTASSKPFLPAMTWVFAMSMQFLNENNKCYSYRIFISMPRTFMNQFG